MARNENVHRRRLVIFPDITADLKEKLPDLRGRMTANAPLSAITWFRVGGPAQVLYSPADEADLAYFLKGAPRDLPVTVVGLGSNLLVRDGGLAGIVIRLGRGFASVGAEPGHQMAADEAGGAGHQHAHVEASDRAR